MAHRLIPVNGSAFAVRFNNVNNDISFQRGDIVPVFELNENYVPTGRMRLRDNQDINTSVIPFLSYNQYMDGNTGLVFDSLDALILFCNDYIFFSGGDGSSSSSGTTVDIWKIKAVPVAADEKPEGARLQDIKYIVDPLASPQGYNAAVIIINADNYSKGAMPNTLNQDTLTGDLYTDDTVGTFTDGDIVIVISSLVP